MDINISEANQFINLHAHPQAVSSNDLSMINDWILKYPYCQTLHFLVAQATKFSEDGENFLSKAATFASNREALFQFTRHVEDFESESILLNDAINESNKILEVIESRNDLGQAFGADLNYYKVDEHTAEEEQFENAIVEEESQIEEPLQEIETVEEAVTEGNIEEPIAQEEEQTEAPVQEIETKPTKEKDELIFESPIASDFFAFAKAEKPNIQPIASAPEQPKAEKIEVNTKEEVSQYNDERLPYTFLWWLNKTRREHASNTQPYIKAKKPAQVNTKPAQAEQSLNHQIAENIFHLRGAEEIGTQNIQNQTVPFDFRRKEFQIIEKFIKEEPQIKPPAANKIDTENKARKSSEDANQVVSETLAKIYVEQMLYHKALDVYKKLSLKYPEKSTYFASQIKYLELKVN